MKLTAMEVENVKRIKAIETDIEPTLERLRDAIDEGDIIDHDDVARLLEWVDAAREATDKRYRRSGTEALSS